MATLKWLNRGLLAGLVGIACLGSPAEDAGGEYVLDFSSSPNRGVSAGKFNNFAFKLDLQQPVKKRSVPAGNHRMPDVVATFDYSDCTKGQERSEEHTSELQSPVHLVC